MDVSNHNSWTTQFELTRKEVGGSLPLVVLADSFFRCRCCCRGGDPHIRSNTLLWTEWVLCSESFQGLLETSTTTSMATFVRTQYARVNADLLNPSSPQAQIHFSIFAPSPQVDVGNNWSQVTLSVNCPGR